MPTIKNIPPEGHNPSLRSTPNNPLLSAASWLADKRLPRSTRRGTKDMVDALLCHGARAWRMSQPRGRVSLKTFNPRGYYSVRIKV